MVTGTGLLTKCKTGSTMAPKILTGAKITFLVGGEKIAFAKNTEYKMSDRFKIDLDLPEKHIKPRFEEIREEMRILGNYWDLSQEEKDKYDKLNEELERIQKNCFHIYEKVDFAIMIKSICGNCGLEDKTYDHFRDG